MHTPHGIVHLKELLHIAGYGRKHNSRLRGRRVFIHVRELKQGERPYSTTSVARVPRARFVAHSITVLVVVCKLVRLATLAFLTVLPVRTQEAGGAARNECT